MPILDTKKMVNYNFCGLDKQNFLWSRNRDCVPFRLALGIT